MKRIIVLIIALMLLLTGCIFPQDFDPEKDSVIDVVTLADYDDSSDREGSDYHWYAISKTQDAKEISEFTPDRIEIYTLAPDAYDMNGCLINKELYDINGKRVETTPILSDILERTEQLEHSKLLTQIFKDGSAYFAYVELNVNWWSPCELYYYNIDSEQLEELCSFDHKRIVGIRIKNAK